jgi:hypothetical protein
MHLSIAAIFTYCVQIVESGLVSAGEPCSWGFNIVLNLS